MPTSPAIPPERSIEATTMRLTFTPEVTAAGSDMPVARRSKPNRVRLRTNQ